MGALLLACYLATLAPGVTFWDAGEFIAAAHGFGIPHPPGTPLYVAAGRVWTLALGAVLGSARAMNLLSALCTAAAGALTTSLVAREAAPREGAPWGAIAAGLSAGLMATAWANATETEVYAVALLHAVVMLWCASRSARRDSLAERWLLCTAYLIALAPALHLSALVGVPAAIALAGHRSDGTWATDRVLLLLGVLLASAGVGRMSWLLVAAGALVGGASVIIGPRDRTPGRARGARRYAQCVALTALGASALAILLLRARHDPAINQANPATLATLADAVARRQYDVAPLLPRQAPVWVQLAAIAQYADWQVAESWGRGIFTTPARVTATVVFLLLAALGARAMRRDGRRLTDALLVLLVSGTLGVAAYLNLKAGTSLGWGLLPDGTPHEARERDYFFVLGFWAWGCFAGYGALALVRRWRWPAAALGAPVLLLAGNWPTANRASGAEADAARRFGTALLTSVPPGGVLFAGGDNDSYPLWYLQQVEGLRRDVLVVTLPLLPADWYPAEIARRTGWRWSSDEPIPGARLLYEQRGALVARAARQAGRVVTASPGVSAGERALLGGGWVLRGVVYQSSGPPDGGVARATIDTGAARRWASRTPPLVYRGDASTDGVAATMLTLLECPRLALPGPMGAGGRDSLEVKCNLR